MPTTNLYAIVKEQYYFTLIAKGSRLRVLNLLPLAINLLPKLGGGERVRTDDPLRARQVLSQLSYTPNIWWAWVGSNHRPHDYQSCALAN